ncbi:GPP34 family phosphoprotein [Lentisphaerota bacterium ZTH]|nr:GPP34 family phosphoprotein [Lentisphaerota bacterium]WET07382.1 GPP34 family phosphoprotein [Lentisphaerota bacterium ZTH]
MLSFAEEIYLMALDEESGKIVLPGGEMMLHRLLVGAVLCEISFLDRIDNDSQGIFLVNTETTNDQMLDGIIDIIRLRDRRESIHFWMENLLSEAADIENNVISSLIGRGIIKEVDDRILWVIPSRRYPIIDNQEMEEVKHRVRRLIENEGLVPDPRDAVIISLIYASGMLRRFYSMEEYSKYEPRIKQLSSLDMLAREAGKLIHEISVVIVQTGGAFRP